MLQRNKNLKYFLKDELQQNILNFHNNMTYENFHNIVQLVNKEMVRGAINNDNINYLGWDILDVALVYKGFKPVCYVSDPSVISFNRLILKLKEISVDNKSFLYIDNAQTGKINKYIKGKDKSARSIGILLGYPEEDIQCYLEHSKTFNNKFPNDKNQRFENLFKFFLYRNLYRNCIIFS